MFTKLKNLVKKKSVAVMGAMIALIGALPTAVGAAPVTFGTNTLTVDSADVVGTGFNFANLFGEYTTLILGVMFVPVVVGFIIWLWRKLPKFGGRA